VRAQALAFTVVLPGWEELGAWRALKASAHMRRLVVVAAADHGADVMPMTCWGRVGRGVFASLPVQGPSCSGCVASSCEPQLGGTPLYTAQCTLATDLPPSKPHAGL